MNVEYYRQRASALLNIWNKIFKTSPLTVAELVTYAENNNFTISLQFELHDILNEVTCDQNIINRKNWTVRLNVKQAY